MTCRDILHRNDNNEPYPFYDYTTEYKYTIHLDSVVHVFVLVSLHGG